MRTIKIDQMAPDPLVVTEIAELLKAGAVVAYPTDTFYGLGVDIYCEDAVKRIFDIKGRESGKPILILISEKDDLAQLVTNGSTLLHQFWPGPLTLVFNASENISKSLTAGTGKIGIRLPDHNFCRMLIKKLGHPMTATSANISGMGSLDNPSDVLTAVGDKIDVLVDGGKTKGGLESAVVDVSGREPVIIREGAISRTQIAEIYHRNLR